MASRAVEARRSGWLTFISILMFAFGIVRLISAFSYFADSNNVADLSHGLFGGNLFWWGIWDLAIAAAALYAGWSLLQGGGWGLVMSYVFSVLAIVEGFMMLFYAPWVGAFAILVGALVLYGVTTGYDETAAY